MSRERFLGGLAWGGFATDRFALSPLSPADRADLFAHLRQPEVTDFMDIDALADVSEADGVISWAQSILNLESGVRWGIRDRAGAFVGTCGFNQIVIDRARRGEIAYDVSPAWWGQKVMDEIMPHLTDIGFHLAGLRRLEAMVTAGNTPSCRLLERHGFVWEGLMKDHAFWKGRYWDQIVFGRVAG
ncbi:MAG: GNAT family protein [Caulobacteraceae bacterium]